MYEYSSEELEAGKVYAITHTNTSTTMLNRTLHSLRPVARAAPALFRSAGPAMATRLHCQVPCGIFDDPVRVELMKEDAATVRKAMVQINELSGEGTALALNQATRWIIVKEDSAKNIITTVRCALGIRTRTHQTPPSPHFPSSVPFAASTCSPSA